MFEVSVKELNNLSKFLIISSIPSLSSLTLFNNSLKLISNFENSLAF